MAFNLPNSLKYLKSISSNKKNLEQKFGYNKNYLFQRQMNSQYRQDKRRFEYERIQQENLKFSQRLINAKAFFNRYEHQLFFDKHCKLKQRLQRYPDPNRPNTNRSDFQRKVPHENGFKNINKLEDSSFLIYNDNRTFQQSIKLREKHSKMNDQIINKPQITQKKLSHPTIHNSLSLKKLPPITSTQDTDLSIKTDNIPVVDTALSKNESSIIRTTHTIDWNISTNPENIQQPTSSSSLKTKSIQSFKLR